MIGAIALVLAAVPLAGLDEEYAAGIEVPWEPEELPADDGARFRSPPPPALLESLARPAIRFYRRRMAVQSIDRCPFHISCSRFAEKAVERFGFVRGVALFVDRHFYREHAGALRLYPLRETWSGGRIKLKLDDSFYLSHKRCDVAE